MSLAEIKEETKRLSADERTELLAHLKVLDLQQDRDWQQEMFRRAREIDAGGKHSRAEVLRTVAERSRRAS